MRTTRSDVAWTLELSLREGRESDFRALMADMVDATETNEPGALDYEWSMSDDDRAVHVHERYADSASTLTHLGTFGAQFMSRFMEVFIPQRLTIYGSPSQEVRAALGAWGPTFMTPLTGFRR